MKLQWLVAAVAAAMLFAMPSADASLITIDFAGSGGLLGTSQVFGPVTAYGFYGNGGGDPQRLFQRNDAPDDVGLGVCNNHTDGLSGNTCGDGGINNEIDNHGDSGLVDLLVIDVSNLAAVNSVFLSSLDGDDVARVFACADIGCTVFTQLATVTALVDPNQEVAVVFDIATYGFLAFDPVGGGSNDESSDYLVRGLNATTNVPEPATLALLGIGLLGIGLFLQRHRTA